MNEKVKALIGVGGSVAVCEVWKSVPNYEAFKASLFKATSPTAEPEKSPLAFIEHYHYGLVSLTVARFVKKYSAYLDGFGVGMVASEMMGEKPFGIGKTESETTGNIILGSFLTGLFLTVSATKR